MVLCATNLIKAPCKWDNWRWNVCHSMHTIYAWLSTLNSVGFDWKCLTTTVCTHIDGSEYCWWGWCWTYFSCATSRFKWILIPNSIGYECKCKAFIQRTNQFPSESIPVNHLKSNECCILLTNIQVIAGAIVANKITQLNAVDNRLLV